MSALNFQPVDANGDVLPGAKLQTFFSTTTTPITTYTDADLTIPHPNPVVADAKGEFPAIFLSIAEHRMVLLDQNDVQVNVYDPVNRIEQITTTQGNTVEVLTASQGQTVFNLSNPYIPGINGIGVYIQGVLQHSPDNYTETTTTSITFTAGLDAGDEVTVVIPILSPVLVNVGTARVFVDNDSFTTVQPSAASGMFDVHTQLTAQAFGKLYFEVDASPVENQAYSGTLFDTTTGPLTGTTGTAGRITVSPNSDGLIYIENRLGSTKGIVYSFIIFEG